MMESRLLSASFRVLSLISVGLLAVDGSLVFAAGPKFQALKKSSVSVDGGLSRGVSWGDFDGDGWGDFDRDGNLDLYFAVRDGQPDRLFRNDGDLDLFVANGTEDTDEIEDYGIENFLYLNRGGGAYQILTMNLDGSDVVALIETETPNQTAVYSPDGRKIAFQSGRPGRAIKAIIAAIKILIS